VPQQSIDACVQSFEDVPLEPGVNTADFLEASRGLVKMFGMPPLTCPLAEAICLRYLYALVNVDLLGSAAFTVVQKDLSGNIAKVQVSFYSYF
jgi:hypothetical protein